MKKIFCRMVSVILLISSVFVGVKADNGFGTDWDLEQEYERISQQKDMSPNYFYDLKKIWLISLSDICDRT